jgi:O-antigen/teichoic acid export membrane protein
LLDLGMAALMARELATGLAPETALSRWRSAERLLLLHFGALSLLAMLAGAVMGWSVPALLACGVLIWAVAAQNLANAAMLALGDVRRAAILQGLGVLLRAALTVVTLLWLDPSLRGFIVSQLAGVLLHLGVNRWLGQARLCTPIPSAGLDLEPLSALARRGMPLFLVGATGAAVTQLDKFLVGAAMGPAAVAPYFLAGTFCTLPIALLAGPMAQYFQPSIIRAHAAGETASFTHKTHQLTLALALAVVLPTVLIWCLREPLIGIWLKEPILAQQVTQFTAILLPAAALGAVGYVPLALLAALGDFGFQARLSTALAALTLAGVTWAASRSDILLICWCYLGYYGLLTTTLWLRATFHTATRQAALRSARWMLLAIGLVTLPTAFWIHTR